MSLMDILNAPATATAIAVVGLLLAIFIYRKQTKNKNLVYANKESVLIGASHDSLGGKLKVTFDDKNVSRVTRSVFVIWNAGRETTRGSDIATADLLRIELPRDTLILLASVDRSSRDAISFKITQDDSNSDRVTLKLSFDFLDYGDGVNLSIVHSSSAGSCALKGTLIGMPKGIKNWGPADSDLEAFRTPRPEKTWRVRAFTKVFRLTRQLVLLVIPPLIIVSSFLSAQLITFFPSLGRPDTTAMLVADRINIPWLCLGIFLLLFELLYLYVVFQRPPKKLTNK
jgi:hypothetical protein